MFHVAHNVCDEHTMSRRSIRHPPSEAWTGRQRICCVASQYLSEGVSDHADFYANFY